MSNVTSATLKKNISANFVGSIWQAMMGLVFVPLYIKFIGVEFYGLIGFFTTIQTLFGLLDMGLGSVLTREMARLSVIPNKKQEMQNLVRTLEIIYWSVSICVGIVVILLSSCIAKNWIKSENISVSTIDHALSFMAIMMIFQMSSGFYSGGLVGLQKQVLLSWINIILSTLRGIGAVLVLWLGSPTIYAFLIWQIFVNIINVCFVRLFFYKSLPVSENKGFFSIDLLKETWKFAISMSGISIFAVILTQLDKIILSKLLSLEMFGYYMLASMVAMSLGRVFTPVFFGIYPRFTQLVSIDDQEGLRYLYHKVCQFFAVLIFPAACVISFFSYEVIFLWTQSQIIAEKTHLILSIMILGTALNGIMNPPYALQLAFGWTKLPLYVNLISVIIVSPLIFFLSIYFEAIGASVAWLILNIGYVLFWIPVMHKKILINDKWIWYLNDVFIPFFICFFVVGTCRMIIDRFTVLMYSGFHIICVFVLSLGVTAIFTPITRELILKQLLEFKLYKS